LLITRSFLSNHALPEEPENAGIQFADVSQFKQTVRKRLAQRFSVILPVAQFRDASHKGSEVTGITGLEFQEEFFHRASSGIRLIKLYRELHLKQHQY
jgi:hypothetical protein